MMQVCAVCHSTNAESGGSFLYAVNVKTPPPEDVDAPPLLVVAESELDEVGPSQDDGNGSGESDAVATDALGDLGVVASLCLVGNG